jgi:hypothetical protein
MKAVVRTPGRQVTTQYDAAGRASKLTGTLGELEKTYMGWVRYAPHGAVDAMQMGNNVWRVYTYNSRLQVQRILDAVDNSPNQLLLDQQFSWGTSDNNGNLQSVLANHWAPGAQPLTLKEGFGYDKLNRVTSVVGKDGNETLQWVQSFGYDRYGNRWMSSNTLPASMLTPTSNIYNGANRMNATGYL